MFLHSNVSGLPSVIGAIHVYLLSCSLKNLNFQHDMSKWTYKKIVKLMFLLVVLKYQVRPCHDFLLHE